MEGGLGLGRWPMVCCGWRNRWLESASCISIVSSNAAVLIRCWARRWHGDGNGTHLDWSIRRFTC